MIISIDCKECGEEIDITYTFGEDAVTGGPVEQSHDGSAPDCEPDHCPACGAELDTDDIAEKAAEVAEDAETERAIQQHEDRMEERRL